MINLKSQTLEEMTATLKEMGEPAFRGKQVFTWLHKGVTSFDEMSNLSKPLREKLKEQCYITAPSVARKQVSKLDGTVKYLWQLLDGNCTNPSFSRDGKRLYFNKQCKCYNGTYRTVAVFADVSEII